VYIYIYIFIYLYLWWQQLWLVHIHCILFYYIVTVIWYLCRALQFDYLRTLPNGLFSKQSYSLCCNIKRLTIRRPHLSYAYGSSNDGPFRSQRSNNFNSLWVFNYNNYHYFTYWISVEILRHNYDCNSRQVIKEYLEYNVNKCFKRNIYFECNIYHTN